MTSPETPMEKKARYWESGDFWRDAGERIVTSFITGFVGLLSADLLTGPNVDIGLKNALIAGGVASVLSTIKAIVGANRSSSTTPVSIV